MKGALFQTRLHMALQAEHPIRAWNSNDELLEHVVSCKKESNVHAWSFLCDTCHRAVSRVNQEICSRHTTELDLYINVYEYLLPPLLWLGGSPVLN